MFMDKKIFFQLKIISIIMLISALVLTQKWLGLIWWKSLILYMLYGFSLNVENFIRGYKGE